jgi:hypothetical protein
MKLRMTALVLLALYGWPASTYAQVEAGVATSFEQLRVLAVAGDTVRLTDASFSPVSGRIDSLTSSTLSLVVNGIRHDFGPSDVTAIWAPKTDSLADGARRGFRIGAVLGLLSIVLCMGECGSTLADAAVNAATFAALGAGIGVGMDARDRETKDHLIYRRPAASGARLTITPRQTGMTMSVRF